jgi:hypothetical protein
MTLWHSRASDPLVHHGRHFGRIVHAMCNVQALVTNGILLLGEEGEVAEESLTAEFVLVVPPRLVLWTLFFDVDKERSTKCSNNCCG